MCKFPNRFSQFTFPGACNISRLMLSVCSTAGFLQQPQTLVSIVVVLSGLQGFRAHRSVSALSWADSALSQREGQWLERVMLVQANVSALHAPSWCLPIGPRFIQDRNLCVTQPLKESECSSLFFSSSGAIWVGSFLLNMACEPGKRAWQVTATNLSTCFDAAGFVLTHGTGASWLLVL